jgi:molecular chaperone DnaK (HSP70)
MTAEGELQSVLCWLGIKVELSINEPTATTITYITEETGDKSNVLLFNLSGGTFNVTLFTIYKGVFNAHTTISGGHKGDKDFDQCIMQYCINNDKEEEQH